MKTIKSNCFALLAGLFAAAVPTLFGISGLAQAQALPSQAPTSITYAVGTFESLGLYHKSSDVGECKVRFRAKGQAVWREGLSLWHDARVNEYRGSLVYLQPGTTYEVELMLGGKIVPLSATTRSDRFAIGKTTTLPAGESYDELNITESGTPTAYHLVTTPPDQKVALDVANQAPTNITINASHVIVRGLELRGAAKHSILIKKGCHDVIIEDCHILTWGRVGGAAVYGNEGAQDAGVYAEEGTRNLTIQRNLIEHPRGASNDWSTGHPLGANGITIWSSQGGNIIRYNTIRSTDDHGFDDGIGGGQNFSKVGNLNRDSDVYGNYVSNVWDDALEIEGSNTNIRVWGNYITQTTQHIATAGTTHGPIYIFRNVFGRSRYTHQEGAGGGYVLKIGGKVGESDGGRRFVFHNTALGPGGGMHVWSGHLDPNAMMRNNYWHVAGMFARNRLSDAYPKTDVDYDIFKGLGVGEPKMTHRVGGSGFTESQGLEFFPARWEIAYEGGRKDIVRNGKKMNIGARVEYRRNGMIDSGARVPNFNDDFAGTAPDIGAFERGRMPLRFGREGQRFPFAPWE